MSDQFNNGGIPPRPVQKPVAQTSKPNFSAPARPNQPVPPMPPKMQNSSLPPRQGFSSFPPRQGVSPNVLPPRPNVGVNQGVNGAKPPVYPQPTIIPNKITKKQESRSFEAKAWNANPSVVKRSQITIVGLLIALILFCGALGGVIYFLVSPPSIIPLSTPVIEMDEEKTKISWQAVNEARWYEIFVNNKFEKNTLTTEYLFSDYTGEEKQLSFKVRAGKNGIYAQSGYSNSVDLDLRLPFVAPISTIDTETETMTFAVEENATQYELWNGDVFLTDITLPEDYALSTYSFSLTNFIDQNIGKRYNFKIRAKENMIGKISDFSLLQYDNILTNSIPTPSYDEGTKTISWDIDFAAASFEIILNENYNIPLTKNGNSETLNTYNLSSELTSPGEYFIRIRSIGIDEYNLNSDFSDSISFWINSKLDNPTNLVFEPVSKVLSWNEVLNAASYTVKFNGVNILSNISSTEYDLSLLVFSGLTYTVSVRANGVQPFLDSDFSADYTFICVQPLSKPTGLSLVEEVLYWNSVSHATSYDVYVDNSKVSTVSTSSMNLSSFFTLGKEYSMYVKANSTDPAYCISEASNTLYYDNKITLSTPTNVTKSGLNLVWDSVTTASKYEVEIWVDGILNSTIEIATNSYNLTLIVSTVGTYTFYVSALPETGSRFYERSEKSSAYQFVYSGVTAPTGLVYNAANKTLTWNAVNNAGSYKLALDNSLYTPTTNSYNFTSIFVVDEIYEVKVKAVSAFDGLESSFSVSIMINTTTPYAGYSNNYFFFQGWNDYKIDSSSELNLLIWYVRTVQKTNTVFYCTYADNSTLVSDITSAFYAFKETSPSTSPSWSYNNNICNLTITYGATIANEVGGNILYEQSEALLPRVATTRTRSDSFNNFYIDTNVYKEVLAENSDHLFLIMEGGAKPKFGTDNSKMINAQTCYNNIKQILREIITDSMTEYEKVLAIYDWLMYYGYYDYETYEDSSSDPTITEHNCFYLEGLFLTPSKRLPVCDAFSKAFVVMCRIEGIEAIKVTGEYNGGGHAWNKVNIVVPGETVKNWFFLDITFDNVLIIIDSETQAKKEILTHSYFLVTDIVAAENSMYTRTANARMYNPACTTTFNIYDYMMRDYSAMSTDGTKDCNITSQSELEALFTFLNTTGSSVPGLEIILNYTFSDLVTELTNAGAAGWGFVALNRENTLGLFRNGEI